jgi:hypothetical protein
MFKQRYQYGEQGHNVMAVPLCLQTKTPPAQIQTFLAHCAPTCQ